MIVNIVGHSGSGKTTVANLLDYPVIQSYTTRGRRYKGEDGHEFITPEDLDEYGERLGDKLVRYRGSPVLATFPGHGYMYFATEQQLVEGVNLYVIDEKGALEVHENAKNRKVITVFMQCDEEVRRDRLSIRGPGEAETRIEDDRKLRNVVKCNYVVNANRELHEVVKDIMMIINGEM